MAKETTDLYKSLIDYNPTLTSESVKVRILSSGSGEENKKSSFSSKIGKKNVTEET